MIMQTIVSGEKIQETAEVYLGTTSDFEWNPYIFNQKHKHKNIMEIIETTSYHNPKIVFCYAHQIHILSTRIHCFTNNFVLITHNSDENIVESESVLRILNCPKLKKWYAQNVCFEHPKLELLPIGIANQQWNHGMAMINFLNQPEFQFKVNIFSKTQKIYFHFNIATQRQKRQACYNSLISKLTFLPMIDPFRNYRRLSEYEFCVCPEGNGVDTHRLWEALYLQCVPIVIQSPFIQVLTNQFPDLPIVVLNSWDDLNPDELPKYETFSFEKAKEYLNLNYYQLNIYRSTILVSS